QEIVCYENPRPSMGIHRMVFVLFRQMGRQTVYAPGWRQNFNTKDFAELYNLGSPVAAVSDDGLVCRNAESLVNGELSSFEFVLSLVIWYEILYKINLVSKKLQSKDVLLDIAVKNLKGLVSYFENYRENGLDNAITQAKQITETIDIEPEFTIKRTPCREKQFDELPNTEREQQFAKE
ncbi:zinc finger MYM-type protein 1-like protein, partial [Tanacetum coccineum]